MSRRAKGRWPGRQRNLSWAFRATTYQCALGAIRVSKHHAWLDQWLVTCQCRQWVWLTADNPGALRCPDEVNLASQKQLIGMLEKEGVVFVPASARGDGDLWPVEQGFLIAGMTLLRAKRLGRQFGQVALLHGVLGSRARIIWLAAN